VVVDGGGRRCVVGAALLDAGSGDHPGSDAVRQLSGGTQRLARDVATYGHQFHRFSGAICIPERSMAPPAVSLSTFHSLYFLTASITQAISCSFHSLHFGASASLAVVGAFRRREMSLRTATNYFIVSLAVADIMVAVLVMPLAVYVEVISVRFMSSSHVIRPVSRYGNLPVNVSPG